MKTIKPGKKPTPVLPAWVGTTITCSNCAGIYQLTMEDKPLISTVRRLDNQPNGRIACPCCAVRLAFNF